MNAAKPKEGKLMLVLDEKFDYEIPRNFRIDDKLKAAASGQFSERTLKTALQKIDGQVTLVDLRRESHGFVNGIPVSWYEPQNNSNKNISTQAILSKEKAQLQELKSQSPLMVSLIINKANGVIQKTEPVELIIKSLETEQELAARLGLQYVRFQVLDRHRPDDEVVDEFVNFVKKVPANTWLYFHCRGGKGRSTTFMALYDILHHGKTESLKKILSRQHALGGIDLDKFSDQPKDQWKIEMANDRKEFIEQFYRYATDSNGYPDITWQEWLKRK
ncbi:MAG: hypothetical protein AB7I18_11035 [Candidatus Berkiella sp.]